MINGEVMDALPVSDRALHYGDGLFETIAIVNGRPRLWSAHMERLLRGCEVLNIPAPETSQLYDEALALCGSEEHAVLKLIYSRGTGGRGYSLPQEPAPRRILFGYPWPDYPDHSDGIRLRFCKTPLACNPVLAGIKHLNRLEQVLARAEWSDMNIHEGLMCDLSGRVKEGTMSNLFWVNGGKLYTPDLSQCGVTGVMREQVMKLATEIGVEVVTADVTPEELKQVDEIFMTNSLIGIWPVAQLEGCDFAQGELTGQLSVALTESLEAVG